MNFEEFICQYYSRIGPEIGKGGEAFVVEDKMNPSKVLKIFLDSSATSEITEQAELFNKFYGENSAVVLSNRAIEMLRVLESLCPKLKVLIPMLKINLCL
ncbi:hypothetical protein PRJH_p073 (plasmid) [Providencia rustigianii]